MPENAFWALDIQSEAAFFCAFNFEICSKTLEMLVPRVAVLELTAPSAFNLGSLSLIHI